MKRPGSGNHARRHLRLIASDGVTVPAPVPTSLLPLGATVAEFVAFDASDGERASWCYVANNRPVLERVLADAVAAGHRPAGVALLMVADRGEVTPVALRSVIEAACEDPDEFLRDIAWTDDETSMAWVVQLSGDTWFSGFIPEAVLQAARAGRRPEVS